MCTHFIIHRDGIFAKKNKRTFERTPNSEKDICPKKGHLKGHFKNFLKYALKSCKNYFKACMEPS